MVIVIQIEFEEQVSPKALFIRKIIYQMNVRYCMRDMIKGNESDVADIVFRYWQRKSFKDILYNRERYCFQDWYIGHNSVAI